MSTVSSEVRPHTYIAAECIKPVAYLPNGTAIHPLTFPLTGTWEIQYEGENYANPEMMTAMNGYVFLFKRVM